MSTHRLEGRARLERQMNRLGTRIAAELADEVAAMAREVAGAAQEHLDAPALRPVSRTGRLARSLAVKASRKRPTARVSTPLAYGAHLEFGTRRMPAYPWLGPAVDALRRGAAARLGAALHRALKRRTP